VKDDNEGMSPKEINKELGQLWNEHKEKNDKVYKRFTSEYKERASSHKEEMEEYNETSSAPKKPKSLYFRYADEVRKDVKAENPDAPVGEIAKVIGKQWKALSKGFKKDFEKKYKKIMEEEKKAYEPYANFAKAKRAGFKETFEDPKEKGVVKAVNKMVASAWNKECEKDPNFPKKWETEKKEKVEKKEKKSEKKEKKVEKKEKKVEKKEKKEKEAPKKRVRVAKPKKAEPDVVEGDSDEETQKVEKVEVEKVEKEDDSSSELSSDSDIEETQQIFDNMKKQKELEGDDESDTE
jgi:hypothetical protein